MPDVSEAGAGSLRAVNAAKTAVTLDTLSWDDSETESLEARGKNVRIHGDVHSVVKVSRNAPERRSRAPKFKLGAFRLQNYSISQTERTFLGPAC